LHFRSVIDQIDIIDAEFRSEGLVNAGVAGARSFVLKWRAREDETGNSYVIRFPGN
jgi:hypothetical protein